MFSIRQHLLSDDVPLEDHIADDVVLMKKQGVMAMFQVTGVFPGTADLADVQVWFDRLHNAWRNAGADDVEVVIYNCRGEADGSVIPPGIHTNPFAVELAASYEAGLHANTLYRNPIYLCVILHPLALQPMTIAERTNRLNELCQLLQSQMESFGLRRLGIRQAGRVMCSEIAEAIVFALTGLWRQIPMTTGRLGNAMFSEHFRFKARHFEIYGAGEPTFGVGLAMKEYPSDTWPGMFHPLALAPYRNTLVQSFRFLSSAEGMKVVNRKQNKQLSAGDKAVTQTALLTNAADSLMNREWVLGDHSLVLLAFADSRVALETVSNAAWRDLAACGLVATRLFKALQAGFLSTIPGGRRWAPRPGFVRSLNFTAFAPLYGYPEGPTESIWGPPICTFRSMAGTPVFFNWQKGDNGNTMITGAPGGGKSLTTAFLIAMTSGRARIIALDHKQGWRFLFREMKAPYGVLGNGEPNFAPLKSLDNSPRNRTFLLSLIRACGGGVMTEEENRRLTMALDVVMSLPAALRGLGEVRGFFNDEPDGFGVRLEKWCLGNELGWVIDAPIDRIDFSGDMCGADVTALFNNDQARGPALLYLFHRIALSLDGFPVLIPVDEGWRALVDPAFRSMIEERIRTIRSMGGVVVFITQSPGEIIDSNIHRVLIEMCPTQLHFANPKGKREDYCEKLGLTEGAFDALHQLQPGLGYFLFVQGDRSMVAQLPLVGSERFIPILSARQKDLDREYGAPKPVRILEAAE